MMTIPLLDFLNNFRAAQIHCELRQRREDAIMVEVAVPGERWEVEFLKDGTVEVEIFRSDGEIHDVLMLQKLVKKHSDTA